MPYDIRERQRLTANVGRGQSAAENAQTADASRDRGDGRGGGGHLRSCDGARGAPWDGGT